MLDTSTAQPPESPTVSTSTANTSGVSLRKLSARAAARLFPAGKVIKRAINSRYAPILGGGINGRRLYQVLINLGSTDPQIFIEWLDREPYTILGNSGSYAHLPGLARRCAVFTAAGTRTAGAPR